MHKGRLEAFSDGVIAIIITIMVLELKVPHGADLSDLLPFIPIFLSYTLSFVNIGIYWNNHHHLFQAVKQVNGATLWANLHLLFWLSLTPLVTAWAGENNFSNTPVAVYGVVLLFDGIAYYILTRCLLRSHENDILARAVGKDWKGIISTLLYFLAVLFAFLHPMTVQWPACLIYVLVALIWLIPDSRISRTLVPK